VIGFWMGSSGTVTRTALVTSTGRTDIDQAFDRAVRTLSIGEAPPAGFEQPFYIMVTPDLLDQCGAADTGLQPIRAEP
jgi:outer membrane biosynthesis protein TonB